MEEAVTEVAKQTAGAVAAVQTPMQLLALALILMFIAIMAHIYISWQDRKTKALVDKDTSERTMKRDMEQQKQDGRLEGLESWTKDHQAEHAKIDKITEKAIQNIDNRLHTLERNLILKEEFNGLVHMVQKIDKSTAVTAKVVEWLERDREKKG